MDVPADLLKAIRSGKLSEVISVLNAATAVELNGEQGEPGLPLAIACFMGHSEIVRELILRGAKVNMEDNSAPTSPLSMAVRGQKREVVKVLIEYGAIIPSGMETGLSKEELMVARWKAEHFGALTSTDGSEIEEINVNGGCYGTDTDILDTEMRVAIKRMDRKDT